MKRETFTSLILPLVGWLVMLMLFVLALCSCGTRKKTVHRESRDSTWNRIVAELQMERVQMRSLLEDIRIQNLQSWSAEVTRYDTAGRATSKAVYTGTSETSTDIKRNHTDTVVTERRQTLAIDSGKVSESVFDSKLDADTTWGANLPWYVWLIGGLVLIVVIWILIKQLRL